MEGFMKFDKIAFQILEELLFWLLLYFLNSFIIHLNWSKVNFFLQQVIQIVFLYFRCIQLITNFDQLGIGLRKGAFILD